jgi:hypothetical protein
VNRTGQACLNRVAYWFFIHSTLMLIFSPTSIDSTKLEEAAPRRLCWLVHPSWSTPIFTSHAPYTIRYTTKNRSELDAFGRPPNRKRSSWSSSMDQLMIQRIQRRFPVWFGTTSSVLDRMCCCSYVGAQTYSDEIAEMDSSYEWHASDNSLLEKEGKEDGTTCSDQTVCSDQSLPCEDSPEEEEPNLQAARKGVICLTPDPKLHFSLFSSRGSQYHRSIEAWKMKTRTTRSNPLIDLEEHYDDVATVSQNNTLPPACDEKAATRISPNVRRWSNGDTGFYDGASSERAYLSDCTWIRQVQSESLAQLPYLSMTEGYEC